MEKSQKLFTIYLRVVSKMIDIRHSNDRGQSKIDWLDSKHTFSFSDYHDPDHNGFHSLLVINEDRVKPAKGFATHGHENMEIISYVLSGALEHRDSLGTGSVIKKGDIQRMSAGTGIRHSEFNHSDQDEVHFLQIWILPNQYNLEPSYEQKTINADLVKNNFHMIGSEQGNNDAVKIHQDVNIYLSILNKNMKLSFETDKSRGLWLQLAKGKIKLNNSTLISGDGASITHESLLKITAEDDSEIILFDLA